MTKRVEQLWGSVVGVDIRDPARPDTIERALDDAFGWFRRVDALFSTWRSDSEVVRLARGQLRMAEASPEVVEVLDICAVVREQSGGAYDAGFATHPDVAARDGHCAIDASGVVKGWALDRAATVMARAGFVNFSLNAGGDVITRGEYEPGRAWRVGIQHPWERGAVAVVVEGRDLAVATSGQYERRDHIVVPHTTTAARGLTSVTVVGRDLAYCDGYATAAVVLGRRGMEFLARMSDYEAMGITDEKTVVSTQGFAQFRSPTTEMVP